MTGNAFAAVVLAAGKGTRMRSALPKVLHPLAGEPMLAHVLETVAALDAARVVVVRGPEMDDVAALAATRVDGATSVVQEPALGTGHAVGFARDALVDFNGDVLVLYGDTPLIRAGTISRMLDARRSGASIVVLGFRPPDPGQYGRLVTSAGRLERIVEFRDATDAEKAIDLCNSGLMVLDKALLFELLGEIGNDNAKREYYLTDVVGLARGRGLDCAIVEAPEEELLGINTRIDLARAESVLQTRLRDEAMLAGVTMTDPETVYLSRDTRFGRDVLLGPNIVFGPGVEIGDDVRINAFSHLEGARVAAHSIVGPFARLRPGTVVHEGAHVGNFVELKNAQFGAGSKANHLAYIGDATVGTDVNIGAGAITCNYDGFLKHRTEIEDGAFIGTNSSLVAPVRVGKGAYTASGSVITKDVAADALAVGRAEQKEISGWATRNRQKKLAEKQRNKDGDA